MRYLKNYEEHNEGIKSGLTKLGLAGSLLLNSPDSKSQPLNPYDYSSPVTNILSPMSPLNPNGIFQTSMRANNSPYQVKGLSPEETNDLWNAGDINYERSKKILKADTLKKMSKDQLESEIRKFNDSMKFRSDIAEEYARSVKKNDDTLSKILLNIDRAAKFGGDSAKFNELFKGLTTHMKDKYGYEIPNQNIEELKDETILDLSDGLNKKGIFALVGWIGSILLASCAIPQAWTSYKDKHSHGISWAFLLLWAFGEIFAMIYVYDKLDVPMMMNYGTNILILAIMIYYKIRPGSNGNSE